MEHHHHGDHHGDHHASHHEDKFEHKMKLLKHHGREIFLVSGIATLLLVIAFLMLLFDVNIGDTFSWVGLIISVVLLLISIYGYRMVRKTHHEAHKHHHASKGHHHHGHHKNGYD